MRSRARTEVVLLPVITSAISGGGALLTVVVAARGLGPDGYTHFAVVWGAFFGIGGALAGVQQEATRSAVARLSTAVPSDASQTSNLARVLLSIGGCLSLVAAIGVSWITSGVLDGVIIGVGLVNLTALTLISGVLIARDYWRLAAALLMADAALRTVAVCLAVAVGVESLLPAAVVAGAGAWFLMLPSRHARSVFSLMVDQRPLTLAKATLRAMGANGCAALLIAGFPFLIEMASNASTDSSIASLLVLITLVRSPMLMIVYAYRPLMLRRLLGTNDLTHATARLLGGLAIGGVVVTAASIAVGPWAVHLVAGQAFSVGGTQVALVVTSAAVLAMLVGSGIALVAHGADQSSLVGWTLALVVTVFVLGVTASPVTGAMTAMVAGPLSGLAWNLNALRMQAQSSPTENADSRS